MRIEIRVVFDVGNQITGLWNVNPRIVCAAGVEQRGIPRVDVMIRAMVIRGGANRTEGKKLNVIFLSADTRKSCKLFLGLGTDSEPFKWREKKNEKKINSGSRV